MKSKIFFILSILFGYFCGYYIHHVIHELETPNKYEDMIVMPEYPYFLLEEVNEEILYKTLVHYQFPEPEFITAQAIIETGNFKSRLFLEKNNMFGLYNSREMEYYDFDCWLSSCFGYKNMILKKKKNHEPMSDFCSRIGYAADPEYINKVIKISNKVKEKYGTN